MELSDDIEFLFFALEREITPWGRNVLYGSKSAFRAQDPLCPSKDTRCGSKHTPEFRQLNESVHDQQSKGESVSRRFQ